MKKVPTYMYIVSFWVLQNSVAYLIANYLKMGTTGIYVANTILESFLAIITVIITKKGVWKQIKFQKNRLKVLVIRIY